MPVAIGIRCDGDLASGLSKIKANRLNWRPIRDMAEIINQFFSDE